MHTAADDHHVRRRNGDVRAAAERDADVRARQRRGVVDAVADEAHVLSARLQRLDSVRFVGGPDLAEHVFDAQHPGDPLGLLPLVAADHPQLHAAVPERADGLGRARSELLGAVGEAKRQCAGLVEHDGVGLIGGLQLLAAAKQHAELRRAAGAGHDRGRRGQPQRAGTGNHERGADAVERRAQVSGVEHEAAQAENTDCDQNDHGHEHGRDLVGQPRDGGFFRLCGVDDGDDLREHGLPGDGRARERHIALPAERAAVHVRARTFRDQLALAREHGFVDCARSAQHGAVDRHALTAADLHDIVGRQRADLNGLHRAAAQHVRRLRLEADQLPDRFRGLVARGALHILAEQDQRQQHTLGEKVQLHVVVHGQCDAGAVQINHGRRHGDQKVHAEHALPQRLVRALVEVCARPELEHGRDRKLSQRVQIPKQGHRQKDADAERP